jgi:hypothetical protein
MMALARDGRRADVEAMRATMQQAAARADTTEGPIFRAVGLPLCEAIAAYGRGDYGAAVDLLAPVRREVYRIGGSHAQRDLFFRLLVAAALRAERYRLARALVAERNALNPRSAWGWKRAAAALEGLGETQEAAAARRRAEELLAE